MKLLGVRMARSIWLIPQYFLNPKGLFLREASIQLKDKYKFLKGPFDNNTAGTQEVKYENGGFADKTGTLIQVSSVVLHPDGVVVDTQTSTDASDAFLEDVGNWLAKDFGVPSFAGAPIKRIYSSELNVILEKPPAFFNPKLQPFLDAVSKAIGDENTGPTSFLTFQVALDPTKSPRQSAFRIDREVNIPFEENRFYSYAPLRTADHMKLLEKLEASL